MDADTIRGMLWGAALGDALSAPHRSWPRLSLRHYTGLLQHPIVKQTRWQGRKIGVVGQVSGDTEMMLALAGSIVEDQGHDVSRATEAYLFWGNSKSPLADWGTQRLWQGLKTLRGYKMRLAKRFPEEYPEYWPQSIGCLTRCAPMALLGPAQVKADCTITDLHPVCIDACQVYTRALRALGAGNSPAGVLGEASAWADTEELRVALADAASGRIYRGESRIVDVICYAFISLRVLEETGAFEDTIAWAMFNAQCGLRFHAGMVGALAGAYLGYEALASEKKAGQNIQTLLAADTAKGGWPRPPRYSPSWIDRNCQNLQAVSFRAWV